MKHFLRITGLLTGLIFLLICCGITIANSPAIQTDSHEMILMTPQALTYHNTPAIDFVKATVVTSDLTQKPFTLLDAIKNPFWQKMFMALTAPQKTLMEAVVPYNITVDTDVGKPYATSLKHYTFAMEKADTDGLVWQVLSTGIPTGFSLQSAVAVKTQADIVDDSGFMRQNLITSDSVGQRMITMKFGSDNTANITMKMDTDSVGHNASFTQVYKSDTATIGTVAITKKNDVTGFERQQSLVSSDLVDYAWIPEVASDTGFNQTAMDTTGHLGDLFSQPQDSNFFQIAQESINAEKMMTAAFSQAQVSTKEIGAAIFKVNAVGIESIVTKIARTASFVLVA